MSIQCENGYVKDGVRGILCRRAGDPKDGDLKGIAHALCGHQRFCPNQRCYTMLPGWEKCTRRQGERIASVPAELCNGYASETREEAAGSEKEQTAGKPRAKKKTARKATEGA